MSTIAQALRGQEYENTQKAIHVIDIILRQHSAKQYVSISYKSLYLANLAYWLESSDLCFSKPLCLQRLSFGPPILFP